MNAGVDAPEWGDVDRGQRPGSHPDDEFPRFSRKGWQSFASTQIEEVFFGTDVWPRLNPTDRALVRSQRGPMASIPFHTPPVSAASRFNPQCFRVLLLRRLWCQLPLSSATCRCGQPLDSRGTTGELAAPRGFWVAEGIRWRVARHGSAGKQEQGCPSTSVTKNWTFCQGQEQTTVVWKWSLMVCLLSRRTVGRGHHDGQHRPS